MRKSWIQLTLLLACAWPVSPEMGLAENWPQYRGADGTGVSAQKGIPASWTAKDKKWDITLPGEGHSSPVVWGDKLFLTTATQDGANRHLICINSDSGKILWSRDTHLGSFKKHKKNSFASASPATDSERVYTLFADNDHYDVIAYSHEGKELWKVDLGPFSSQHGFGASPIVFEDLLIIPNEQDGPSAIVALDRRTGKNVWSTPRTPREASYATPLIFQANPQQKPQLICVSGSHGVSSLDPWTGQQNWSTGEMTKGKRTVASPMIGQGLVYGVCGQGGKGHALVGVSPTGEVKVERDTDLPYVPTSVAVGDLLFLWGDNGVVTCLKPLTGTVVWKERVGGSYSGSPICIDGRLFAISEAGTVVVIAASETFAKIAENDLEDASHATPVVANGKLFLRTFHRLICIPAKQPGA